MEPPYAHQIEAGQRLWVYEEYALIMEQGTGKSRPVIRDWIRRIYTDRAHDLVVMAPKGCYMNWIGTPDEPGEITKWVEPDRLAEIVVTPWVSSANATQTRALRELLHATKPRFLCMNIEALNTKISPARQYLKEFVKNRIVIGCVDESTTIAHESAQRTSWLLDNLWMFPTRRILSGLVAPESPLDLYSQYCYLNWEIIGQKSFYGFKNRYAVMQKMNFTTADEYKKGKKRKDSNVVVAFKNLEELHQRIMARSYRVTKDQCLDLPPKIYQFYDVDLTDEQQKAYVQMRDAAYAELDGPLFATATMKLDQLGKMQHILCGHVRTEDGSLADIPENRTNAVVEILQGHSGKAIIWAPYPRALRKIVAALREEFGHSSTVGFWGEHDLDERLDARARIQRDEECRFIVSNQSVGKFGNTWVSCNLVIYFANSFDSEDRQQSEDRTHRIGQTKSVTYIDLRAKGTLDERLIYVLRKKINMAAMLQGDEFRQWLI